METFTRYALIALAEVCTVAALIAGYEAHQYMTIGYGLHPFAALPAATLLLLLPFGFLAFHEQRA